MRDGYLASVGLAGVLALLWLLPTSIAGRAPAARLAAARPSTAPRTPCGDPDLQGLWHVVAQVPLERAHQYAGREFLTDEEVAALDKGKAENLGRNSRAAAGTAQDVGGAYNAVFNSILKTGKRTSMIIDPKDGKIPPLTEEAQKRQAGQGGRGGGAGRGGQAGAAAQAATAGAEGAAGNQRFNNPEDIGPTRCLG